MIHENDPQNDWTPQPCNTFSSATSCSHHTRFGMLQPREHIKRMKPSLSNRLKNRAEKRRTIRGLHFQVNIIIDNFISHSLIFHDSGSYLCSIFITCRQYQPANPVNIKMSFFSDVKSSLHTFTSGIKQEINKISDAIEAEKHSHTNLGEKCHRLHIHHQDNRFHSFAPPRTGNDAKWFVDGCGYFWAVSVAIEEARKSIWILDWWLSPGRLNSRCEGENSREDQLTVDRALLTKTPISK